MWLGQLVGLAGEVAERLPMDMESGVGFARAVGAGSDRVDQMDTEASVMLGNPNPPHSESFA